MSDAHPDDSSTPGMPHLSHQVLSEAMAGLDAPIDRLAPEALPDILRGTQAAEVLTRVGLPRWMGNTLDFDLRLERLRTVADHLGRHAPRPTSDCALIILGQANLYYLCVDPATGEVVAHDRRRGRRPVSTDLARFVDVLCTMADELSGLCDSHDAAGQSPRAAWSRLTAALHRVDPAAGARAEPEWWLLFSDLCADYEIDPDEPEPTAVRVILEWSSGALSLQSEAWPPDEAAAVALRRRFASATTLLDQLSDPAARAAAVEMIRAYGGAPAAHPAALTCLDLTGDDDPLHRLSCIPVAVLLGWPELRPMLAALAADEDSLVRATAGLALALALAL